tara:strand:+ start:487 stop:1431 length:945 start_codon:yes stop_codon:yes gene_type:complete
MTKNKLSKKTIYSIIFIILSIVTFMAIAFTININASDRWMIKYKLRINEKALIYLDNIDTVMLDLRLKSDGKKNGLLVYVEQLLASQPPTLNSILPNVNGVEITSEYLIFITTDLKNYSKDMLTLTRMANKQIKKDLKQKLTLYNDIAAERVSEQNEFIISQLERIILVRNQDGLDERLDVDLDNYIGSLNLSIIGGQQQTIDELKKFLDEINSSKLKKLDSLNILRTQYASTNMNNSIHLIQLKKRTENVINLDIVEMKHFVMSKNLKAPLIPSLIIAAAMGLIISVFCIYFYLTNSIGLLKKKLAFLQNLEQ